MATVCLVPEDENDIVTGNLLGAEAKEDIDTGNLLSAASAVDITTGSLLPSEAINGLTPLGDCS